MSSSVPASTVYPPVRFVAGGVGTGLVVAAVTNTCTMARCLARFALQPSADVAD